MLDFLRTTKNTPRKIGAAGDFRRFCRELKKEAAVRDAGAAIQKRIETLADLRFIIAGRERDAAHKAAERESTRTQAKMEKASRIFEQWRKGREKPGEAIGDLEAVRNVWAEGRGVRNRDKSTGEVVNATWRSTGSTFPIGGYYTTFRIAPAPGRGKGGKPAAKS